MPEGIYAEVTDGLAEVTFLDRSKAGAALARALSLPGGDQIKVRTGGTQRSYLMPESVATEAGFIDAPERKTRKSAPRKAAEPDKAESEDGS